MRRFYFVFFYCQLIWFLYRHETNACLLANRGSFLLSISLSCCLLFPFLFSIVKHGALANLWENEAFYGTSAVGYWGARGNSREGRLRIFAAPEKGWTVVGTRSTERASVSLHQATVVHTSRRAVRSGERERAISVQEPRHNRTKQR